MCFVEVKFVLLADILVRIGFRVQGTPRLPEQRRSRKVSGLELWMLWIVVGSAYSHSAMDARQEQVVPWLALGLSMVLCLWLRHHTDTHTHTPTPTHTHTHPHTPTHTHTPPHTPTHPHTHTHTHNFSKPCHAKRAFYLGKTLKSQQKNAPSRGFSLSKTCCVFHTYAFSHTFNHVCRTVPFPSATKHTAPCKRSYHVLASL